PRFMALNTIGDIETAAGSCLTQNPSNESAATLCLIGTKASDTNRRTMECVQGAVGTSAQGQSEVIKKCLMDSLPQGKGKAQTQCVLDAGTNVREAFGCAFAGSLPAALGPAVDCFQRMKAAPAPDPQTIAQCIPGGEDQKTALQCIQDNKDNWSGALV